MLVLNPGGLKNTLPSRWFVTVQFFWALAVSRQRCGTKQDFQPWEQVSDGFCCLWVQLLVEKKNQTFPWDIHGTQTAQHSWSMFIPSLP